MRETKLQPTFTPGWEAHPGVKVGCSFVARQKTLYSRLVAGTGSKSPWYITASGWRRSIPSSSSSSNTAALSLLPRAAADSSSPAHQPAPVTPEPAPRLVRPSTADDLAPTTSCGPPPRAPVRPSTAPARGEFSRLSSCMVKRRQWGPVHGWDLLLLVVRSGGAISCCRRLGSFSTWGNGVREETADQSTGWPEWELDAIWNLVIWNLLSET